MDEEFEVRVHVACPMSRRIMSVGNGVQIRVIVPPNPRLLYGTGFQEIMLVFPVSFLWICKLHSLCTKGSNKSHSVLSLHSSSLEVKFWVVPLIWILVRLCNLDFPNSKVQKILQRCTECFKRTRPFEWSLFTQLKPILKPDSVVYNIPEQTDPTLKAPASWW